MKKAKDELLTEEITTYKSIHPKKMVRITCYRDQAPFDELIMTGEAAFELIANLHLDREVKNAFHQLRELFGRYGNLVVRR